MTASNFTEKRLFTRTSVADFRRLQVVHCQETPIFKSVSTTAGAQTLPTGLSLVLWKVIFDFDLLTVQLMETISFEVLKFFERPDFAPVSNRTDKNRIF
jgi:hypothetical protein